MTEAIVTTFEVVVIASAKIYIQEQEHQLKKLVFFDVLIIKLISKSHEKEKYIVDDGEAESPRSCGIPGKPKTHKRSANEDPARQPSSFGNQPSVGIF